MIFKDLYQMDFLSLVKFRQIKISYYTDLKCCIKQIRQKKETAKRQPLKSLIII